MERFFKPVKKVSEAAPPPTTTTKIKPIPTTAITKTAAPPPTKRSKMRIEDEDAVMEEEEEKAVISTAETTKPLPTPLSPNPITSIPTTAPTTETKSTKNEKEEEKHEEEEQHNSSDEEEDGDEEDEEGTEEGEEEKVVATSTTTTTTSVTISKRKTKVKNPINQYHSSTTKYDVLAGFKPGEPIPYLALSRAFVAIESTSQRLGKTEILANLLRTIVYQTPNDLLPALYLIAGKVGPDFSGTELGVGESLLIKAIADATGQTSATIKSAMKVQGDLGKIASASKNSTRTIFPPAPLTVKGVFSGLREIALSSGNQSRNKKQDRILRMLVSCRESESQYIIRMLQGKFRIGCSEKTVLAALARALIQTPPGQKEITNAETDMKPEAFSLAVSKAHDLIVNALAECPSYDEVIPVLLEKGGLEKLNERCHIRPGMPVHPMLAQPTKGVGEVLSRLEKINFTAEYKYDGERAQIHLFKDPKSVSKKIISQVYSRNLEDSTGKFPDVAQACIQAANSEVESAILDSEAVGWDPIQKRLLPFQILSHRARKSVETADVKIKVCVFAFDLLFLNGKSLLSEPLRKRRQLLHEMFREIEGSFVFATFKNIAVGEEESAIIQPFLEEAVSRQCEGLMVKALDSQSEYLPNQRSFNWLKIKKDYMEGMTDSVDLVPIGAWYGTGKRTGWFGGFLLACYDEDGECFQAITKLGTGLSDSDLEEHRKFFEQHIISAPKPYYSISPSMKSPDVWLDALQVWEVKGADLTISPVYTAASGLVDENKGISLRFPRFLRIRTDKKPEDATNAEQIASLYRRQPQLTQSVSERHAH